MTVPGAGAGAGQSRPAPQVPVPVPVWWCRVPVPVPVRLWQVVPGAGAGAGLMVPGADRHPAPAIRGMVLKYNSTEWILPKRKEAQTNVVAQPLRQLDSKNDLKSMFNK